MDQPNSNFDSQTYLEECADVLHSYLCQLYHPVEPEHINNSDERVCSWEAELIYDNPWSAGRVHRAFLDVAQELLSDVPANENSPLELDRILSCCLDLTGLASKRPALQVWIVELLTQEWRHLNTATIDASEEASDPDLPQS